MAFAPLSGAVVRGQATTVGQTNSFSQQFTVGQTIKGVVLQALPEGKTLVNFAGQHVVMELNHPLDKGQSFLARIEQASPALMLKVLKGPVPNPTDSAALVGSRQPLSLYHDETNPTQTGTLNAAQLKSYLVAKQPVIDMLTALQKHLAHNPILQQTDVTLRRRLETTLNILLPKTTAPPDADGLKAQINQSGINYEAHVQQLLVNEASPAKQSVLMQDLKGQLLELSQGLNQLSSQQAATTTARQQVQQAIQNIEFQQLANLFAQQEHQFLLLQVAHPALLASHTAKLFFRAKNRSKGNSQVETQDYTLVFLLDFSALGNIRIDAMVHGQQVVATIKTEDETVAHFIRKQTDVLTVCLQNLGFHAEISCRAQETVVLDVDDSLTRVLMVDPSQLVDIKA
ncbi:MAG: hypothetical protein O7G88_09205 [bacterium]|nr:hypothetical protein [bacterium]